MGGTGGTHTRELRALSWQEAVKEIDRLEEMCYVGMVILKWI